MGKIFKCPRWLRLWNPRYFINPFFSPSLYWDNEMKRAMKIMIEEINKHYG